MLKDILSPEYTDQDALELWRVRVVLERARINPRQRHDVHSMAIGFMLGLNFDLERAMRMADAVQSYGPL